MGKNLAIKYMPQRIEVEISILTVSEINREITLPMFV